MPIHIFYPQQNDEMPDPTPIKILYHPAFISKKGDQAIINTQHMEAGKPQSDDDYSFQTDSIKIPFYREIRPSIVETGKMDLNNIVFQRNDEIPDPTPIEISYLPAFVNKKDDQAIINTQQMEAGIPQTAENYSFQTGSMKSPFFKDPLASIDETERVDLNNIVFQRNDDIPDPTPSEISYIPTFLNVKRLLQFGRTPIKELPMKIPKKKNSFTHTKQPSILRINLKQKDIQPLKKPRFPILLPNLAMAVYLPDLKNHRQLLPIFTSNNEPINGQYLAPYLYVYKRMGKLPTTTTRKTYSFPTTPTKSDQKL